MDTSSIPRSMSLENASKRFTGGDPVSSWLLVREILQAHPEYAGRMGGKLAGESGPAADGDLKPADEWLQALTALFDPVVVKLIDGRLAIWGCSEC